MADPPVPAGLPADTPPAQLVEAITRERKQNPDRHPPGFYDQVLEWVEHPDETVREAAIHFLGRHFQHRSHAQVLLEMLVADPVIAVRKAAADCLGGVFRATRNREVCEVLAGAARNTEEEAMVRTAAFAAIKRINGY